MTIMKDNHSSIAIIGKLSIERCQTYLAHLHALMHLYRENKPDTDNHLVADNVLSIMESIERELEQSARALRMFG